MHAAEYTVFGNGVIQVANKVTPDEVQGIQTFARVGLKLAISKDLEQVEWVGRGPHENYPDPQIIGIARHL